MEFIISISMMFIIGAMALQILFKKDKQFRENIKEDFSYSCSCQDAVDGRCEFDTNQVKKREFFSIETIGGGAYGGKEKGGSAGEVKTTWYPVQKNNPILVIQLGEGGNSVNRNGGQTIVYKRNGENLELLEFAKGGIYSNERFNEDNYSDEEEDSKEEEYRKGEIPSASNTNSGEKVCGKGGDAGDNNGEMGEVIIKW